MSLRQVTSRGAKRKAAKPRATRPNYDLRASQIETPARIVKFFWEVVHTHRSHVGSVLDMGAGDGKFARHGNYDRYTGVEIDASRIVNKRPRRHATVRQGCVFAHSSRPRFDACIGNPPYLRHHDIESPWKEKTIARLGGDLDVSLSGHSNLFLYFIALSLIRTKANGLCALLVPFDWVTRPAAKPLREIIQEKRWSVHVYRFSFPVFDSVDTTASISVIDRNGSDGQWHFYDVDDQLEIHARRGVTGTGNSLLQYSRRGSVFARRGISPGTQDVFVLTEGDRIHHGLALTDVVPCVTSLRGLDSKVSELDRPRFEQDFVKAGRRCWLIKSKAALSDRLKRYLAAVPAESRATATCQKQTPWYNYEDIEVPGLLLHSGFTTGGPQVVVNRIGAIPVGSMYGIYGCSLRKQKTLLAHLRSRRIMTRVVPHSGRLKKIEVGQLNSVLKDLGDGFGQG